MLRLLGWGALTLLLSALVAAVGGWLWLRTSLPELDGEVVLTDLSGPVEVVRDRHGIPHILAQNEEDALFALGFVHAQDRLWQMEMNRRVGAGRLAEVLGAAALDTDRLLRTLGLYRRAEATRAYLTPESRHRIGAYTRGVNAWLEARDGPLPPEFLILGFEPSRWRTADSLVWPKVMALDLGREWTRDLMRLRMSKFLPPDRILDFYPPYRNDKPWGVVPREASATGPADSPPHPGTADGARGAAVTEQGRVSNAASHCNPGTWPASGNREESMSHPWWRTTAHPGAELPQWIPATAGTTDTTRDFTDRHSRANGNPRSARRQGNTHPGGWASAGPATPTGAAPGTASGAKPPEDRRRSTTLPLLSVAAPPNGLSGSNSWIVDGTRSATGRPLLANDPHLGLGAPSSWYFVHLSWPGHDVVGATFPGLPIMVIGHNGFAAWGMTNTGPDVQDLFIERIDPQDPDRYLTPSGPRPFEVRREVIRVKGGEDVVLQVRETRHGPVLYGGWKPARSATDEEHVLALAWTALREDDLTAQAGFALPDAKDWNRFVDAFRDFHSPQQSVAYADVDGNIGLLAPARLPIRTGGGPRDGMMPRPGWDARYDWQGFVPFEELPHVYNPPGRVIVSANHPVAGPDYPHYITCEWAAGYRAERIMERLAARPRHDVESFRALQHDSVSNFARALLPRLRQVALGPEAGELALHARDLLIDWNADMAPERPEPLIFHAWIWEFGRLIATDELGPLRRDAWGRKGNFIHRVLEEREVWCDDQGTSRMESCDEMLARSLISATERLAERLGRDPAAWSWGHEHIALGEHLPLGKTPLARFFNLRGPAPGSMYTVNAFSFSTRDAESAFVSDHGPSLRVIYDLADLDRSLFIHSSGQSGNVLSPLYRNFEQAWRTGGYITIPTRRKSFDEGALGQLRLTPR